MLSICLAFIHNNNEERNAIIRPNIEALAELLKKTYLLETIEISYQPEIIPLSSYLALKRDLIDHLLEYQWRKYRGLPTSIIRTLLLMFEKIIKKHVFNRSQLLERWKKSSAIDLILTDKHLRAWDRFLESNADILVCFEDDAIFNEDSHEKFIHVLQKIQNSALQKNLDPVFKVAAADEGQEASGAVASRQFKLPVEAFDFSDLFLTSSSSFNFDCCKAACTGATQPVAAAVDCENRVLYVDLAGGCRLSDLRIENLEEKREDFLIFYKKPVTNTTCAYLINRLTAERFKSILVRNSFCRLIPVDWMINKLLIELDKQGIDTYCFHTNPTVFEHGSASGKFQTWHR